MFFRVSFCLLFKSLCSHIYKHHLLQTIIFFIDRSNKGLRVLKTQVKHGVLYAFTVSIRAHFTKHYLVKLKVEQ